MICQACIESVTYIHRSREWFHKNDQFLKALVGELASEKTLPTADPIGGEEEFVKGDTELIAEANIFQSGSIEGEEDTLDQITGAAEPIGGEEGNAILPDDGLVKEESSLALITEAIEGEEVTLDQITGAAEINASSNGRKRRRAREVVNTPQVSQDQKTTHRQERPLGSKLMGRKPASSYTFHGKKVEVEWEKVLRFRKVSCNPSRRFRCHCGLTFVCEGSLKAHIQRKHEGQGLVKAIRPNAPNPLVLEEMAAVFNRVNVPNPPVLEGMAAVFNQVKTQAAAVEPGDEIHEIEDD